MMYHMLHNNRLLSLALLTSSSLLVCMQEQDQGIVSRNEPLSILNGAETFCVRTEENLAKGRYKLFFDENGLYYEPNQYFHALHTNEILTVTDHVFNVIERHTNEISGICAYQIVVTKTAPTKLALHIQAIEVMDEWKQHHETIIALVADECKQLEKLHKASLVSILNLSATDELLLRKKLEYLPVYILPADNESRELSLVPKFKKWLW